MSMLYIDFEMNVSEFRPFLTVNLKSETQLSDFSFPDFEDPEIWLNFRLGKPEIRKLRLIFQASALP